jgi:hypothetical protein
MIDMLIKNRHAAMDALNALDAMYLPVWKWYFVYGCILALHGLPMLMYHCMKFFGNRRVEQDWHDLNTVSGDYYCEVTDDDKHQHNWFQEGF